MTEISNAYSTASSPEIAGEPARATHNPLGWGSIAAGVVALAISLGAPFSVFHIIAIAATFGLAIAGLMAKNRPRATARIGLVLGILAVLIGAAYTIFVIAALSGYLS
ncbi:lysylphosphatidylglycerol synthetase-like protein (DUF2156 family) [Salinibacterium sp. CAN_S4]|uniref:hypothetical protein n=1 Tax=Salinibacterium sp. CAN_S4 TaxID=2787727 RepID=UPI0018EF62D0